MSGISNHTLSFLSDLKANNNKSWFDANRDRYESSKLEMEDFMESVISHVREFDVLDTVSGKKSLYRIFRDVRFSKDKTPYKTWWSGFLKRAGEDRRGGFGVSIEPGNSKVMGGFYGPNKEDLLLIRQQISQDAAPLREVINSEAFLSYFGQLHGEQVKTAPKGFNKEDPAIDLLRYKQFLVRKTFTDKEVLAPNFDQQVAEGLRQMHPFFDVMTMYLTTDLNGVSLIDS